MASSLHTSDVSNAEELDLYFQEWVTQSKQLKIVVTGLVGSGKSALINSLIDGQLAEEGDSAASVTSEVEIYAVNKNGVDVVLYDTPGLLDPWPDENKCDVPTLSKIQKETDGEIDLLLICKRMGSRVDRGDIRIMQQITRYMGESVWKNAAYVLTFANEVKPSRRPRGAILPTEAEYFEEKLRETDKILHEYLHEEGHVSADIAKEVPVVPAGYDDPSLPGCSNWFEVLWLTACSRIKAASQPAFLQVVHIPEAVLPDDQLKSAPLKQILQTLAMKFPAMIAAKFHEWFSKHKKD